MTLLAETAAHLRARDIPFALVGAGALAVHGVARSTLDLDLLVTTPACLSAPFWDDLRPAHVEATVRRGDADDPLAGVVRLRRGDENPVDVIIGRADWQAAAITRARASEVEGAAVPVVTAADLVLLKLFAGGPQDAWDVTQLLAGDDRAALVAAVERMLPALPAECPALWRRLRDAV